VSRNGVPDGGRYVSGRTPRLRGRILDLEVGGRLRFELVGGRLVWGLTEQVGPLLVGRLPGLLAEEIVVVFVHG